MSPQDDSVEDAKKAGRWGCEGVGCGERVRASCRAHPVLQQAEKGEHRRAGQGVTRGQSPPTAQHPEAQQGLFPNCSVLTGLRPQCKASSWLLAPGPETKLKIPQIPPNHHLTQLFRALVAATKRGPEDLQCGMWKWLPTLPHQSHSLSWRGHHTCLPLKTSAETSESC